MPQVMKLVQTVQTRFVSQGGERSCLQVRSCVVASLYDSHILAWWTKLLSKAYGQKPPHRTDHEITMAGHRLHP